MPVTRTSPKRQMPKALPGGVCPPTTVPLYGMMPAIESHAWMCSSSGLTMSGIVITVPSAGPAAAAPGAAGAPPAAAGGRRPERLRLLPGRPRARHRAAPRPWPRSGRRALPAHPRAGRVRRPERHRPRGPRRGSRARSPPRGCRGRRHGDRRRGRDRRLADPDVHRERVALDDLAAGDLVRLVEAPVAVERGGRGQVVTAARSADVCAAGERVPAARPADVRVHRAQDRGVAGTGLERAHDRRAAVDARAGE